MAARRLLISVVLVTAATGVGASAVGATIDSGIHGLVLYGPTCPVQRPGEICERPLQATVLVSRAGSTRLVSRTGSGRNGRFTFRLTPGRYLVRVTATAPLTRTRSGVVSVTRHRFTALTLRVDSGIR